jgi:hypothetical protein
MAKSLRPGHEEHGGPALREAWRRFLASKEAAEYARPGRFREGLGQWFGSGVATRVPARASPTVGERAMSEAGKFLEAVRGKGGAG